MPGAVAAVGGAAGASRPWSASTPRSRARTPTWRRPGVSLRGGGDQRCGPLEDLDADRGAWTQIEERLEVYSRLAAAAARTAEVMAPAPRPRGEALRGLERGVLGKVGSLPGRGRAAVLDEAVGIARRCARRGARRRPGWPRRCARELAEPRHAARGAADRARRGRREVPTTPA